MNAKSRSTLKSNRYFLSFHESWAAPMTLALHFCLQPLWKLEKVLPSHIILTCIMTSRADMLLCGCFLTGQRSCESFYPPGSFNSMVRGGGRESVTCMACQICYLKATWLETFTCALTNVGPTILFKQNRLSFLFGQSANQDYYLAILKCLYEYKIMFLTILGI